MAHHIGAEVECFIFDDIVPNDLHFIIHPS